MPISQVYCQDCLPALRAMPDGARKRKEADRLHGE